MTANENPATRANASTGQAVVQSHQTLSSNVAELQAFLESLGPRSHRLVAIAPDGGAVEARHFAAGQTADAAAWAARQNSTGRGVYWTPNTVATADDVKPRKADIAAAAFAHVDIDPQPGEDLATWRAAALARLEALPFYMPKPLVIASGGGLNVLWPLETPVSVEEGEALNRALAHALGGDPGTWNADRLLRLPATMNHPNRKKREAGRVPTLATVLQPAGGPAPYGTLAADFPPLPAPKAKADASADIDFEQVFARSDLEDLPTGLASRFRAACERDPGLAQLWAGKPLQHMHDTSRSGFRFALATRLSAANAFNETEIATLLWVAGPHTGGPEEKTERTLSRDVSRSRRISAADEFDEVEIPERAAKPKGFALVRVGAMVSRAPEFLVDEIMETDSLALIFGDPGSGKSFLAIDLAACVASGMTFHGRTVRQGPVIYLAGEGHNGLKRRTAAWEAHRGASLGNAPLFFSTSPARLLDAAHAVQVREAVDAVARTEGPPRLIVVDTLARSFAGGDENATKDMGEFIASIDALKGRYPGCTVLIVHHSGHGDKQRARGAMALKGALDCEYRCELTGGVVTVENTKMKDAPPPAPMTFELQSVEPSAVLVPGIVRTKQPTMTPAMKMGLDTFRTAQGGDEFKAVSVEEWRPVFYARHTGDTLAAKKKAFQRVREALVSGGYLAVNGETYDLAHADPFSGTAGHSGT